jgi:signal transduction histidine kinase
MYLLVIIFFILRPIYSSDTIFKISDLDKVNGLSSRNAGNWKLTDQKIDIESYSQNWLKGETDTIEWKDYSVPSSISNNFPKPLSNNFSVVLKKEIIFPENWNSSHISLFIRRVSDRDRTYMNGYLIGSTGEFDQKDPQAIFQSRIYEIPNNVIKKGVKNLLIIEIQNYFEDQAGILNEDIEIGPSLIIFQSFQKKEGIKIFIGIIFFLIGCIFLFVYLFRKEKKEYLFYSLFNICFSFQQISISQVTYDYIVNKNIIWHIPYLFLPLVFSFFSHFMRQYFKISYSLLHKILDFIIIFSFFSILIFNNMKVDLFIWKYIQIPISLIYISISIFYLFKKYKKSYPDSMYMLISFVLLIPSIFLDYLSNLGIFILSQMISPFFILSFDVSLALILSIHIEKIRREIKELNTNLEDKVNLRTQDIKNSLEQINNLKISEDNLHYFISIRLKKSVDEIKDLSQVLLQLEFIESQERRLVLNKIYKESDDLFLTLQKLISWTQLQKEEEYGTISQFPISEVLINHIEIYKELALRKGITLTIESEPISLYTNKDKLIFILRELLSNAIKYTNEGGKINLRISKLNETFHFSVIDSGIGMEINKLENIMKNSDSSFITKVEEIESNLPLGIKLCRIYIHSLDGNFEMESNLKLGTKVSFSIKQK